jgi:hypothetical protein
MTREPEYIYDYPMVDCLWTEDDEEACVACSGCHCFLCAGMFEPNCQHDSFERHFIRPARFYHASR